MNRYSIFSVCCALSLFANPQNGIVISGSANFEGVNSSQLIITPSDRSIIHWDSFSIGANEITRFIQGSPDAAVLNRVVGGQMSELYGKLIADGQVFLINPQGIIVGPNGSIDVGSFIASSFDISNLAFLNGENLKFEGASTAPFINLGKIKAQNGDVLLLAHRIEHKGEISAPQGSVLLGAGHEILVGVEGKNFLYVKPTFEGEGISNEGKIEALRTIIEANTNVYELGIQNKGQIDALQVEERGGSIYLSCKGGTLQNEGTLTAPKGKIELVAEDAFFENHSSIVAEEGTISLLCMSHSSSLADQKRAIQLGVFDVSGTHAGKISIVAPKFSNEGSLLADGNGGSISVFSPGSYIETKQGHLSANGENGSIHVLAGHYFTSGFLSAKGQKGGLIHVESERLLSTAGIFDASGTLEGGNVSLQSNGLTAPLHLNSHTVINVSGQEKGGRAELYSPIPINCPAEFKTEGKIQGNLILSTSVPTPQDMLGYLDPNPDTNPLLWTSLIERAEQYLASHDATNSALFDYNDPAHSQLSACPPLGLELIDPHASGVNSTFGDRMLPLSTGNIVVTKSGDDSNRGAVYLYNVETGALISSLFGSTPGDTVGSGSPIALTGNGNYVIRSGAWNSDRGAVTFGNGNTGVSGIVSAANSLVGSTAGDQVSAGNFSVTPLVTGHYVVATPNWTGSAAGVGAVTFCNGTTGRVGTIDATNSLVGSQLNDHVGSGVIGLSTGKYAVLSSEWDNGATVDAGAVTLVGTTGLPVGLVTTANSLVGSNANDQVGGSGVLELSAPNAGNYVVRIPAWNSDRGAGTWVSGTTGLPVGSISAANSLVGSTPGDEFAAGLLALSNGNYVLFSSDWTNAEGVPIANVGAVTWGNGATGTVGVVGTVNSLVGTTAGDHIGGGNQVKALLVNGNYVVPSPDWDNGGTPNAGAVTWRNGTGPFPDVVSAGNSLVGTTTNDSVGVTVTPLSNGNYAVRSQNWDNSGIVDAGAATFCRGDMASPVGAVTPMNSLVGTHMSDFSSGNSINALANGTYVVLSSSWDGGRGAATFVNSSGLPIGPVSDTNSLVGSVPGDAVGGNDTVLLSNGNYVVSSSSWNGGLGAATWVSGTTGLPVGAVSAANSLVGAQVGDFGSSSVNALSNGNYVVINSIWDNGAIADAGAVTWGNGTTGVTGVVSAANSIVGSHANDQLGSFGGSLITTELSSDEFVIYSDEWNNSTGAITIANSNNGTFCNGTKGEVSASNSFVGVNENSGMSTNGLISPLTGLTARTTLVTTSSGTVTLVQFTDYNGQTRVFSVPGTTTTTTPINTGLAIAIHDFAVVVSEGFNVLSTSQFYVPFGWFRGLQLYFPSLVLDEDEDKYPEISYN